MNIENLRIQIDMVNSGQIKAVTAKPKTDDEERPKRNRRDEDDLFGSLRKPDPGINRSTDVAGILARFNKKEKNAKKEE